MRNGNARDENSSVMILFSFFFFNWKYHPEIKESAKIIGRSRFFTEADRNLENVRIKVIKVTKLRFVINRCNGQSWCNPEIKCGKRACNCAIERSKYGCWPRWLIALNKKKKKKRSIKKWLKLITSNFLSKLEKNILWNLIYERKFLDFSTIITNLKKG